MLSGADILTISALVVVIAALYSSVGHGGASGYLAVMTLFSIPPMFMSSTALLLNVVVSLISFLTFRHTRHVSGKMMWPFLIGSVPAAFIGGLIVVSPAVYSLLLAFALVVAAARLALITNSSITQHESTAGPRKSVSIVAGAGIGMLSGIVGIGGGVFLGPVLLLKQWATAKQTAGICAGFILVNSIAGLVGRAVQGALMFGSIGFFVPAAVAGGLLGSYFGARKLPPIVLRRVLALVLMIAAAKLFLSML